MRVASKQSMSDLQRAYDRIIGPLEDRMIRSIWRVVGNAQDADDAMQNALLIIWKRWGRITSHPCPEALILKICIDAAYDVTRRGLREQRRRGSRSATQEPADPTRSPAEQLIQAELYSEVVVAIRRLSRHQAAAILMRVVGELTYGQIAAAIGCTEATVRKHVARARERLRTMLPHLEPNKTTRS
jgi:RNA polymerase sigma-70 factor, ECF subfamily